MPLIPALSIPLGYRAQSEDTSPEIDWIMFERLRQLSLPERVDRYCAFNTAMRSLGTTSRTCRVVALKRLGAEWLNCLKYPEAEPMIIDPIAFSRKVIAILDALQIEYYIGGSFASSIYGESRNTRDIDLVIEIERPQVQPLVEAFLAEDFYISETAVVEALTDPDPRKSFNVLDNRSVEKADLFVLKNEPFAYSKMQRRQLLDLPGVPIFVCSAEDIVLQKLVWRSGTDSDQQWQDILGVLKIQGDALDQDYLATWATQLGILTDLNRALREAGLGLA